MKPNFPYANQEGASICQLNAKGYAVLGFVDGMFEEDIAFANFRAAGGTAEDWLRLLAELTEPELKPNELDLPADYLELKIGVSEKMLNRIFPVDAEFHLTPKES